MKNKSTSDTKPLPGLLPATIEVVKPKKKTCEYRKLEALIKVDALMYLEEEPGDR